MHRVLRLVLLVVLICAAYVVPAPAHAKPPPAVASATTPGPCVEGVLPSGALSMFCVPSSGWNGDLVIWAHGYVSASKPLGFYHLELPGSTITIPQLTQGLGFAFATTSYRQNGLTILEGVEDVRELLAAFPSMGGRVPGRVYMTGASEGGIITTLLIERHPELFNGGLAACGPVGNFRWQIDYMGDFRVLFDYFFPGVIPAGLVTVPQEVMDNWDAVYVPRIYAALQENPAATEQLLRTSKLPTDPADPSAVPEAVENLLWYHVFATNDAAAKLGGNPYGNRFRRYSGSDNDTLLNATVPRIRADPVTFASIQPYQTAGVVTRPLIQFHTTGDEIVPFWHQFLYALKVGATGSQQNVTQVPSFRYGHCNFSVAGMILTFGLLVSQVTGTQPTFVPPEVTEQARHDFDGAVRAYERAKGIASTTSFQGSTSR